MTAGAVTVVRGSSASVDELTFILQSGKCQALIIQDPEALTKLLPSLQQSKVWVWALWDCCLLAVCVCVCVCVCCRVSWVMLFLCCGCVCASVCLGVFMQGLFDGELVAPNFLLRAIRSQVGKRCERGLDLSWSTHLWYVVYGHKQRINSG